MTRAIALLAALVALVVAACGAATTSPASGSAGAAVTVTGAWARAAAAGAETAVYFTLTNPTSSDDTLTGVATNAAQTADIHQTSTDANGMTGMQMMSSVKVPAGGSVQFAPGGYHVMLTNLKTAIKAGDQVRLTLTFAHAGAVTVVADVRAS